MNKKYISPSSTSLELFVESAIMQSSDPSFDVDQNKESDVVLSNKQEGFAWSESNWSNTEED